MKKIKEEELGKMAKQVHVIILRKNGENEGNLQFVERKVDVTKETEKMVKGVYQDGNETQVLKRKLDVISDVSHGEGLDRLFYKVMTMDEAKVAEYKAEIIKQVKARVEHTKKVIIETELDLTQLEQQ